ncbi:MULTISPECIES: substrate-binding domain-containing protein [unclassified Helicobacter]|uniref:substrate-binding domain-containing protein n=1 Tax=unclassified Helicobacter TaxID=2593540 RepID=UPI000CF04D61|nr:MULTISPECIES: substrate-binding domain-containing protein [unclassified Helicobacter]
MKKYFKFLLTLSLGLQILYAHQIDVISREEGSGTRGAFVELLQIQKVNKKGKKVDAITQRAEITNSTSVVLSTVSGNKNAIGYISLGSLNNDVKVVSVDGAVPSVQSIRNKTYPIARPFNIVTKEKVNLVAQDFINFILSQDGQAIVDSKGYIGLDTNNPFSSTLVEGKITISGSSSIAPVMEALKEAYLKINPKATIQLQQSDSTIGVTSVIQGISDIGMVSRELKQSEKDKGVVSKVIAIDGIVLIVNQENPIANLTQEQIKEIYIGNIKDWKDLQGK